ncbi:NAD(P)-dependent oxidoreductase [Nocardioides bruguierae]|uniref:NAD(P)-dependent oxidoreductase n=1 Tax=Nocardioides bruguierae TaxID=2945102 RepID=A0A9X2IE83_9ACTN|nr:NAD(P)-dependent oxidoreductase [Nocardioides bruguierae]MCM0619089.1 NAD(P)-dependent oxidoreductase [Nocardioides bruguierae]
MTESTTATPAPVVAVLGTGIMGAGMARNIAGAGLEVRVWNRSREKAEPLADVATVAESAAEAVAGADVVVSMLFDREATATVVRGIGDGFADGAVWVQCSTVGVEGAAALAEVASEVGVTYVDAPVLGTRKPAEDGTLVMLASGPDEARDAVAPVFDAISSRVMWVGPAGDGQKVKLTANAWVLTVVEGIAESLTLARDLGIDPALFLEAVSGGAMDAPYVQLKGKAMLAEQHAPSFALSGGLKDAGLILEAAHGAGVDLGIMPAVREHLARAVDAGHGDLDLSATYLEH